MDFLSVRTGIASMDALKSALMERLKDIDLNQKKRDFAHLVFNERNADRILQFPLIIDEL
jgi:hypothetical protein